LGVTPVTNVITNYKYRFYTDNNLLFEFHKFVNLADQAAHIVIKDKYDLVAKELEEEIVRRNNEAILKGKPPKFSKN
jgi:hypothetical protein